MSVSSTSASAFPQSFTVTGLEESTNCNGVYFLSGSTVNDKPAYELMTRGTDRWFCFVQEADEGEGEWQIQTEDLKGQDASISYVYDACAPWDPEATRTEEGKGLWAQYVDGEWEHEVCGVSVTGVCWDRGEAFFQLGQQRWWWIRKGDHVTLAEGAGPLC